MKKVMLFIATMLFTVSASAASLNLSFYGLEAAANATNNAIANESTGAISFNTVDTAGNFFLGHTVVSAVDQVVNVEWTFNKQVNFVSGVISKGTLNVFDQVVTGIGYNFNILLLAGQEYFFDILGVAAGTPLTVTQSISAVPVPAALFLFAPALLSLLSLRRKATTLVA